jgi:chromosome segregation ATPase
MASSSWLKNQRREKISERDTLVKRKNSVDNIISKIASEFENNVVDINKMISNCSSYYSSGLKGRKKSISSYISSEQEKNYNVDTKIHPSYSNLQNESKRCQTKIDTLNSEIASLDSQIKTAEYNEAQARKKALEEYLASLKGGKTT